MSNKASDSKTKKPAPLRANALDPRAPLLTQPFKRLVEEGFLVKLSVEFTPNGVTTSGVPDARMIAVEGSGLVKDQAYPLGQLAAIADNGNLIPVKGKTKSGAKAPTQPLPEKSLTKEDFNKTSAELFARAKAVAQKCTGSTLVGRVRSSNAFNGSATISFQNWWKTAKPAQRAIALTAHKQRMELSPEDVAKLADLQCPFLGPAEFTVAKDDDGKAPTPPSKESRSASPKK
jgi:hypothetical protein